MPLTTLTGEKEVMALLRTIPNVTWQEGSYLEDGYSPEANEDGLFEPYALVEFGGSYEFTADNGLAGPRWDTQRATFTIYMAAPFDAVARQVKDRVKELLVGFRPTDGSALRINTGYAFTDADLGYNRYVQVIGFSYQYNLSASPSDMVS